MNAPSIGGFQLTRKRTLLLAALAIDIVLMITGRLEALVVLLTIALVAWGGLRLIRFALSRRFIWKVRNRLIVTYLWIAFVPITLILIFFRMAGWVVTSQFAGYLVSTAMEHRAAAIEAPARLLARDLPAERTTIVQQLTATGFPAFAALVSGNSTFRYPADATIQMPPKEWNDYTGVV